MAYLGVLLWLVSAVLMVVLIVVLARAGELVAVATVLAVAVVVVRELERRP